LRVKGIWKTTWERFTEFVEIRKGMPIESINSLNNKLGAAGRDSTSKFESLEF
jgi:hypothetical protein